AQDCIRLYSFLCFFFSSRRRHTRSDRDWSSDVCSSDLYADFVRQQLLAVPLVAKVDEFGVQDEKINILFSQQKFAQLGVPFETRSEERRVGKECRCMW